VIFLQNQVKIYIFLIIAQLKPWVNNKIKNQLQNLC